MKKLLLALPLILSANSLEIENLRTDLYSKSGVNVLKKIELSLEFEGENVDSKKTQIIDSINTVISGFFYEDIFTESGKNNFKKTLEKFIEKKYKFKVDEIYILSLSGIEKFDIEEFKKFLQSTEAKEKNTENELKKILDNIKVPEVKEVQTPHISEIPKDFFDNNEQNLDDTDINPKNLDIPKITPDIEEKIKRDLISNQELNRSEKANILERNHLKEDSSLGQNLETNQTEQNSNLNQNLNGFELNFDENETSI
ncbi:flagellar basal body-associated FliL family protein [Campylobacter cuniculorum]|uniref:flagellar basal body-associated FliL family protein n=1 Tax=Campylobacter cuniculorum TaxID=374106 RepID=UPI0030B85318